MNFGKLTFLILVCSALSVGCHRPRAGYSDPQVVYETPPVPEGTEKYCWQEPKVTHEKNGPGIDEQGHFYHPSYTATREVKMGHWVPCSNEAR